MATSARGTVLVAGTGDVAACLGQLLRAAHTPYLVTTDADLFGEDPQYVEFDWLDKDTYAWPFEMANPPITHVFIDAPSLVNVRSTVVEFVEVARAKGARRFVLSSSSVTEAGMLGLGEVHDYLEELGSQGEVEWAVLRPTWLQEQFSQPGIHRDNIRVDGKIFSATGDGKIPWVSIDDVAAVAFRALASVEPPNTDCLILGPELLSYSQVADILTDVLGKEIVHVDRLAPQLEAMYATLDPSGNAARVLGVLDMSIRNGSEDRTNDVVLAVTGKEPKKFREFAEKNKWAWL